MVTALDRIAEDYVRATIARLDGFVPLKLRGFDMDGVICTMGPPYIKCKPLLIPGGRFIIISARPESARKVTEQWLEEHGVRPEKLHLMKKGRDFAAVVNHKAAWCRTCGVELYYESDLPIARALSGRGIQVFHVRRVK